MVVSRVKRLYLLLILCFELCYNATLTVEKETSRSISTNTCIPYRRCRGGKRRNIPVKISPRLEYQTGQSGRQHVAQRNENNLICLHEASQNIEVLSTRTVKGNHGNTGKDIKDPSTSPRLRTCVTIPVDTSLKQANTVFACWNARSILNKPAAVCDFIISRNIDILGITESWMSGTGIDNIALNSIKGTLPGYEVISTPRVGRAGGGLCLIHRNIIDVAVKDTGRYKTFESMDVTFSNGSKSFRTIIIYRPPKSPKHKIPMSVFYEEFNSLMELVMASQSDILVAGDFNFHVDNLSDPDAKKFLDCINSFGLQQLVTEPTHIKGHTLDLLFTNQPDPEKNWVTDVLIHPDMPSDHFGISCIIGQDKPAKRTKTIKSRKLKGIVIDDLRLDIESSSLVCTPADNLENMCSQYEEVLTQLLDKHAPIKSRTVTDRTYAPWYDVALRGLKQKVRQAERRWRKSKLTVHQQIMQQESQIYYAAVSAAKSKYHKDIINETDPKHLFKEVKKLISGPTKSALPTCSNDGELAESFSKFFAQKVDVIREGLDNMDSGEAHAEFDDGRVCESELSNFEITSEESLRVLINKTPAKSSKLDPIRHISHQRVHRRHRPSHTPNSKRVVHICDCSGCTQNSGYHTYNQKSNFRSRGYVYILGI